MVKYAHSLQEVATMKKRKSRRLLPVLVILTLILGLMWIDIPARLDLIQGDSPWELGDNAALLEAADTIQAFALDNGYDCSVYPQSLLELLARNPETEEYVLNYPSEYGKTHEVDLSEYENCEAVPLFMQWDSRWGYLDYGSGMVGQTGCGPVCMAMVAYYWTHDEAMSPANMVQYAIDNGYCITGSGTAWKFISEGGEDLGFDVTQIPLDKDRIFRNLEVGNPIIAIMGPGDFTTSGHFIVLAGLEDGMIVINDPNSHANSEKLWTYEEIEDQIKNLWVIRA